ncbi:MAG: histone deacetylase [Polyangiaceae bacterium]|nr:histone deacetylase [Polyangiaceae bacterium]
MKHPTLLPVWFTPAMVADSASYSPSAAKPRPVVERWLALGLPIHLETPEPVDEATLGLAHDPDYVADVLAGRRANGFNNRSIEVARSLPFTTGAMLAAARSALQSRRAACAPCSGFHHARWDSPSGYCTFNGLAVTALALLRDGAARRVGILDCDYHYGDGTDAILERVPQAASIVHFTAGERYHSASQARALLAALPRELRRMADAGCDVVLYQAGADPHVDDPLGGLLTTAQLAERDRLVFVEARRLGLPVAWNLAGGYQRDADGSIEPVLQIHENTMRACIEAWAE